ncbi:MAG: hypothetical protein RSB76_03475 [Clostridia bacterium]
MKNLYVYVENDKIVNAVKYGMKLSIYANKVLSISNTDKKGIIGYLSPKDSELYFDNDYTCLRVNVVDSLNIYIFNKVCENSTFFNDYILKLQDYQIGNFEEPIAIICSTILPENIFEYNKTIDLPLLVENSKEFYYDKTINELFENDKFTKFELYQMLLILGEQKKIFSIVQKTDKLKIYKDMKTGKTYTKKSSF